MILSFFIALFLLIFQTNPALSNDHKAILNPVTIEQALSLPSNSLIEIKTESNIFSANPNMKPTKCTRGRSYKIRNDSEVFISVGLCRESVFKRSQLAKDIASIIKTLNQQLARGILKLPIPLTKVNLNRDLSADVLTLPVVGHGIFFSPTIVVHLPDTMGHVIIQAIIDDGRTKYPVAYFKKEHLIKGTSIVAKALKDEFPRLNTKNIPDLPQSHSVKIPYPEDYILDTNSVSKKELINTLKGHLKKADKTPDPAEIMRYMKELGPEAKGLLPELMHAVSVGDERTASVIIGYLPSLGPEARAAIPELVRLNADKPKLGYSIRSTLKKLYPPSEKEVPLLIKMLRDSNIEIRRYASVELGKAASKSTAARSALLKELENGNVMQTWNASALSKAGPQIIPEVVKMLKHNDPNVRAECLDTLARLGPEASQTQNHVIGALNDPDRRVRSIAISTLGIIDPDPNKSGPILLKILQNESESNSIRASAAQSLGFMMYKESIPYLKKIVNDKKTSKNLRGRATFALEKFGIKP